MSSIVNIADWAEHRPTDDDRIRILLRPHEGTLCWQSPNIRIAPANQVLAGLFEIQPATVQLGPYARDTFRIKFDPRCADANRFIAHAVGYVTVENEGSSLECDQFNSRCGPLMAEKLRIEVTVDVERPR